MNRARHTARNAMTFLLLPLSLLPLYLAVPKLTGAETIPEERQALDAPKLEIYPPTGRSLTTESRAKVMELINAHTRDSLEEKDRLRIGFGALKNSAALTAVTVQGPPCFSGARNFMGCVESDP